MSETIPDSPYPYDDSELERLPTGEYGGIDEAAELSEGKARGLPIEELRAASRGWLERRGIDPGGIPQLTMGFSEFDLFINTPDDPDSLNSVRDHYGIPWGDQDNCWYAFVDVTPDGSDVPDRHELVDVTEADFGTIIDLYDENVPDPFDDPQPDSPTPESSDGAVVINDIGEMIDKSWKELREFAEELMKGKTQDPFGGGWNPYVRMRAGEPAPGQKDAFVWEFSGFTRAMELTLAFPHQYESICAVRGQRRDPINGKFTMAQIENPEVVLKIEGEHLKKLQGIYRKLYHEPGFAVSKQQREERSRLFNDDFASFISSAANRNQSYAALEQARTRRSGSSELRTRQARLP